MYNQIKKAHDQMIRARYRMRRMQNQISLRYNQMVRAQNQVI